jgi:hypothetical protein
MREMFLYWTSTDPRMCGTKFWPSPECIPMSLLWRAEPVKLGTQQTNKQKSCLVVGHREREREREKQSNKFSKLLRVSRVPKKSLIKLPAFCAQNLVSAVQQPFLPSTRREKKYKPLFLTLSFTRKKNLGLLLTDISLSLFRSSSPFQNPFGKSHSWFQHSNKIDKRVWVLGIFCKSSCS